MPTERQADRPGVTVRAHLARAILDGRVWITDGNYVGKASDGVEVSLGIVGCEDQVERYLADNPDPATW